MSLEKQFILVRDNKVGVLLFNLKLYICTEQSPATGQVFKYMSHIVA